MASAFLAQRQDIQSALELAIERHPDPNVDGLSKRDAAWPYRLRRIVRASLSHWGQRDLIETAELLVTELVTNALQHGHGHGPDIGVRVYLQNGHCVIKVNDGSPLRPRLHHAGPADEGGRGLFLVESLAESWGISQDGTTTWCTLRLPKESADTEPATDIAPVLPQIPLILPADPNAARLARLQARPLLTMLNWPGDQHLAIDVLHVLVDNAVHHAITPELTGQHFGASLSITEAYELLIDVTDPNPTFPNFDKAVAGEWQCSLREIAKRGAALSWYIVGPEFAAKTVRAVLRPGTVDL